MEHFEDTPPVDLDGAPIERPPVPLLGIRPEVAAAGIDTFDDLPLHERIREAVVKIGWTAPTPVQKLCLPYTLRGRDVAGFAQTGTGKTGVFLLTIANRLLQSQAAAAAIAAEGAEPRERVPRAIVIAPTRELAMQIEQDAEGVFALTGMTTMAVFGGIDYDKQARQLKDGVDVIFATPGRLMDYVKKKLVDLTKIEIFVCDEADRMFDMGFIEDVEFFLHRIPETAQKLLFSATTNEQVKELAFEYLETPEYVSVTPETITPEKIEMHAIHCHATDKLRVLLALLKEHNPVCCLIFTNTKLTAEWLHFKLCHNGIEADLISGDLPQKKRIRLIEKIKEGTIKALVATDVASRGLHISRVTHVYNFDLPDEASNYVHRVGRTARAGARGFAYSLVCDDYGHNLADINDLLGSTVSMTSEWPKDDYLTITDQAGNPFQERYDARAARQAGGRSGAEGPRSFDRGDRPDRGGGGGDRDRGPRGDGRGDRDRGPRGDGRGDRDRGPRPERTQEARGNEPRRPQQQGGNGQPRQDNQPFDAQGGDAKRKRRRRGKGGGDRDGAPNGQPQQQGGQQGRHGGQQGRGNDNRGGRPGGRHDQRPLAAGARDEAPKSMGGMIKKIVKALFGWGK